MSNYSLQKNNRVYRWLILGVALIALMVIVGGITRLTQSGLSMVEWKPIMGTLPPMSAEEWNHTFDLYKESPEFKHYNSDFSLSEFKQIFFWEYLHRLLGRLIGLVFFFPFVYFWIKGYLNKKLKIQLTLVLLWGGFQGVLGWIMVKSGLVNNPHVSHYRLAAHLVTAIGLMCFIYWISLSIKNISKTKTENKSIYKFTSIFIVVVFIQLIYGAFVAGLKAGLMYNTFPKMGANWLPAETDLMLDRIGAMAFLESGGLVQFTHRLIAYVLLVLGVVYLTKLKSVSTELKKPIKLVVGFLLLQITLGVITLLMVVPVSMGVLHQSGALLVLLSAFNLLYISRPSLK